MMIQKQQSFTALQTIDDILVNEIMAANYTRPYIVDYGFTTGSALGTGAIGVKVDLKIGLNMVAPNIEPALSARTPVWPDDYIGKVGVVPGDRIILTGRETSNNVRILWLALRFTPFRR